MKYTRKVQVPKTVSNISITITQNIVFSHYGTFALDFTEHGFFTAKSVKQRRLEVWCRLTASASVATMSGNLTALLTKVRFTQGSFTNISSIYKCVQVRGIGN